MFADSGDIITQALAWSSSAAARIECNATPLSGLLAYCVLIECNVRRHANWTQDAASSIETPVTSAGVPSREPPSTLTIDRASREETRRMPL